MACSFCGEDKEIHADSMTQYGEPVCKSCYQASYEPDPDSSSDWKDTSGHDVRQGDRSRHLAEFHAAQKWARQRQY